MTDMCKPPSAAAQAPAPTTPQKPTLLRRAAQAVGYCIWAPWWVATSPWRATHWLLSGLTGLELVLLSAVVAILGWQWMVHQEARARKAARKVRCRLLRCLSRSTNLQLVA
jgi:hypothetical protein